MHNSFLFIKENTKYLSISMFFVMLVMVIWGVNKGFDITDEGYYLLGYQKGQEIGYGPSGFHYVVKGFFGWMNLDIINIRILRLLFSLISVLLLSFSIRFYLIKKVSFLHVFSFLGIGTLLSYTYGPQSLSYNSLISCLLIMSLSLLIIGINKKGVIGTFSFVFSGLLLALSLVVKFPPVLIFLVFIVLFFIFYKKWTYKKRFYALLKILVGIIIGLFLFSFFCVSIFDFYHDFKKGIDFTSSVSQGHGIESLIDNVGFLFIQLVSISGFLLFIFILIKVSAKLKLSILGYVIAFLLVIFFIPYYYDYLIKYPNGNSFPYLFFVLIYVLYSFQKYFLSQNEFVFKPSYWFLIFLFIFPFVGALGTDNPFLSNSTFMISSWFALVLLVNDKLPLHSIFNSLMTIFLLVIGLYLFYNQYIQNPYRTNGLQNQTESLINERVKVDARLSDFVAEIDSILKENNFKKGDPIISLYKMPGLVYLLEGKSPGGIISLWDYRRTGQFLEELKTSNFDYSKSYFLINSRYSDSLIMGLNNLGLKFPSEFKNIGKVYYRKIDSPNKMGGWSCYLYAHKSKLVSKQKMKTIDDQTLNDLQKAGNFLSQGNYDKCIELYNKILINNPNNTSALNNMGLAYMRKKQYKNAVGYFKRAVEIDPSYQLAKNNLNWAINELNRKK